MSESQYTDYDCLKIENEAMYAEIKRLRAELRDTQWQLIKAQRELGYAEPDRALGQEDEG